MVTQGIDRSEILIRPYKDEDREQVTQMLIEGFWPVGDRLFKVKVFRRSTYILVTLMSCILALISVWLLIPIWQDPQWSTIQRLVATLPQTALDYWTNKDLTTILGLQFLSPQFLTWWLVWAVVVGVLVVGSFYHHCIHRMAGDYVAEAVDDDMSDLVGYYQSDEPFPRTATYKKYSTVMLQAEAKYKALEEQDRAEKKEDLSWKTKNHSQFWVACLRSHPQVVMGCGALDDFCFHSAYLSAKNEATLSGEPQKGSASKKQLELRRMSVHTSYRRLGILGMLVDTMKDHARQHGFDQIVLSTTLLQVEAIGGYKKAGFQEQHVLMAEPDFGFWFGALDLKDEGSSKAI
ncbi:hypothetical protein BGZ73_000610 [Actinomortierella ambigua]|nr:hypothetical protein BGZ73_000610 [Actinomortierella ambigua]